MQQHVILVLTERNDQWFAHSRDFPKLRVEGRSAQKVFLEAAQLVRREIHKARLSGQPLPRLHSYADIRIDDGWSRERGIRWSRAIVRMVNLPPRLQEVFSAAADSPAPLQRPQLPPLDKAG